MSGVLAQKVAQEGRGQGLASQGRWARALRRPDCVSLVLPSPPLLGDGSVLSSQTSCTSTHFATCFNDKVEGVRREAPRCPPSSSHVLCPPARPQGEPSLPVLRRESHPSWLPRGGWAPAMPLLNLPAYLAVSNSRIQLAPPSSPSLPAAWSRLRCLLPRRLSPGPLLPGPFPAAVPASALASLEPPTQQQIKSSKFSAQNPPRLLSHSLQPNPHPPHLLLVSFTHSAIPQTHR